MDYDWVAEQILNHELSDAVTAIVARGKDDMGVLQKQLDICAVAWERHFDNVSAQNRELRKALKTIAEHGDGLARVVAQLALKELDRA